MHTAPHRRHPRRHRLPCQGVRGGGQTETQRPDRVGTSPMKQRLLASEVAEAEARRPALGYGSVPALLSGEMLGNVRDGGRLQIAVDRVGARGEEIPDVFCRW